MPYHNNIVTNEIQKWDGINDSHNQMKFHLKNPLEPTPASFAIFVFSTPVSKFSFEAITCGRLMIHEDPSI